MPVDEDPLSGAERIDITDLERFELLLPAPGTALRAEIDAAIGPARVVLRPAMELEGVRTWHPGDESGYESLRSAMEEQGLLS